LSLSSLGYRCCPIDIELSGLRENINRLHDGKPTWPEPCGPVIRHLGQDGAVDDDQLLLGGMEMPRYHASGECL